MLELFQGPLATIPIPREPDAALLKKLGALVESALVASNKGRPIEAMQQEINKVVFELYHLPRDLADHIIALRTKGIS